MIVLVLLTTVLVSGVLSATLPTAIFADSRTFKLDTKQNASCDTAGSASLISDSCNQRAANNVNNGVPRTGGAAAAPNTGTLLINVVCNSPICLSNSFVVSISPVSNPPSFQGKGSGSQTFVLSPGNFLIDFSSPSGLSSVFSGDCKQIKFIPKGTGTISAGQHLTCTITVRPP